jgi:hypothetical protein
MRLRSTTYRHNVVVMRLENEMVWESLASCKLPNGDYSFALRVQMGSEGKASEDSRR